MATEHFHICNSLGYMTIINILVIVIFRLWTWLWTWIRQGTEWVLRSDWVLCYLGYENWTHSW